MPMYDYECGGCGSRTTVFRKIADLDRPQECAFCTGYMQRLISAPMVQASFTPYESPKTGKMITSRDQMRDDLARSGSFILEKGVKEDIAKNRAEKWAKTEAQIENLVQKTAGELTASGRI